jgi:excisionase family DNA binding protein
VLDEAIRALVEEVVRRVVREELAASRGPARGGDSNDRYLSIAEVADLVSVSTNTVRGWCTDGLSAHQVGRVVRIKRSDLDRFLTAREPNEPDPDSHAAEILARRERR